MNVPQDGSAVPAPHTHGTAAPPHAAAAAAGVAGEAAAVQEPHQQGKALFRHHKSFHCHKFQQEGKVPIELAFML